MRARSSLLWLGAFVLSANAGAQFVLFPTPTSGGSLLRGICVGPDGNVWYTVGSGLGASRIGRMTMAGAAVEFDTPTPNAGPVDIVQGPDGNLWFVEGFAFKIGRASTAGAITEFPIPDAATRPFAITNGPDGALWVTDTFRAFWRVTVSGAFTKFPLPVVSYRATTGADGNLWFSTSDPQIGRMTPSGAVTLFSVGGSNGGSNAWTYACEPGPDGRIWFTTFGRILGNVTTAGQAAVFPFTASHGSEATSIAVGSDGNLWMPANENSVCTTGICISSQDGVMKVGTDGSQTFYAFPPGLSLSETSQIAAGPDGSMWITADRGLIRFFPAQLAAAASGPIPAVGPLGYAALALFLGVAALWLLRR